MEIIGGGGGGLMLVVIFASWVTIKGVTIGVIITGVISLVTVAVTVTVIETMPGESFATAATFVSGMFLVTVTVTGTAFRETILLVIFGACGEVK